MPLETAIQLVRTHFSKLPSRYALNVEATDVLIHMRLMTQARKTGRITVDVQEFHEDQTLQSPQAEKPKARSVITISCLDRPNLLDSITRIITRLSSTIQDADCMTTKDGLTLDRFTVEHIPPTDERVGVLEPQALATTIERALNHEEDILSLSPSRVWRSEEPDTSDTAPGKTSPPLCKGASNHGRQPIVTR